MLVLSRHEDEKLMIGNSIVLTVVRISGDKVLLGIEAPREVKVVRGELPAYPPPKGDGRR